MTDAIYPKVDEAKELTEKVIAAWKETGSHGAHEDFADAFYSVGQLWMQVSAQMLYNVYKDDNDDSVKDHMGMMLAQVNQDAEEARVTLAQFGIKITTIEDI